MKPLEEYTTKELVLEISRRHDFAVLYAARFIAERWSGPLPSPAKALEMAKQASSAICVMKVPPNPKHEFFAALAENLCENLGYTIHQATVTDGYELVLEP